VVVIVFTRPHSLLLLDLNFNQPSLVGWQRNPSFKEGLANLIDKNKITSKLLKDELNELALVQKAVFELKLDTPGQHVKDLLKTSVDYELHEFLNKEDESFKIAREAASPYLHEYLDPKNRGLVSYSLLSSLIFCHFCLYCPFVCLAREYFFSSRHYAF